MSQASSSPKGGRKGGQKGGQSRVFSFRITSSNVLVAYQLNLLLQARPQAALPLSIHTEAEGLRLDVFAPPSYQSLAQAFPPTRRSPLRGLRLLDKLLDSLLELEAYLLHGSSLLLSAQSIFLRPDTPSQLAVICLPLTDEALSSLLPQRQAQDFIRNYVRAWHLPPSCLSTYSALFQSRDYAQLQAKLRQELKQRGALKEQQELKLRGAEIRGANSKETGRSAGFSSKEKKSPSLRARWQHWQQSWNLALGRTQEKPLLLGEHCYAILSTCKMGKQQDQTTSAYILGEEFVLGRDAALADFVLNDPSCGRQHARITREAGSFFLTDLAAKNGSYVNGQRLSRNSSVLLPPDCELRFANLTFKFRTYEGCLDSERLFTSCQTTYRPHHPSQEQYKRVR